MEYQKCVICKKTVEARKYYYLVNSEIKVMHVSCEVLQTKREKLKKDLENIEWQIFKKFIED